MPLRHPDQPRVHAASPWFPEAVYVDNEYLRRQRCHAVREGQERIAGRFALRDELTWPDTSAGTTPTPPYRFR